MPFRRRLPCCHCRHLLLSPALLAAMQYGWAGSGPHELDSEQADLFQEAYAADPAWAAKGPALLQPPRLAGGRLVIELTSLKEAPKVPCCIRLMLAMPCMRWLLAVCQCGCLGQVRRPAF